MAGKKKAGTILAGKGWREMIGGKIWRERDAGKIWREQYWRERDDEKGMAGT
jgi:hypothetical protein